MFYLSRGEQLALAVLVLSLLAGGGVLTYQRGVKAGRSERQAPLFVEARQTKSPAPSAPRAQPGATEMGTGAGGAPSVSPPPARRAPGPASPASPAPLSLNTATQAQLEALPGIGTKLAQRIIEHRARLRDENGRGFTSTDQLLDVSGIGPKRFAALQGLVVP